MAKKKAEQSEKTIVIILRVKSVRHIAMPPERLIFAIIREILI